MWQEFCIMSILYISRFQKILLANTLHCYLEVFLLDFCCVLWKLQTLHIRVCAVGSARDSAGGPGLSALSAGNGGWWQAVSPFGWGRCVWRGSAVSGIHRHIRVLWAEIREYKNLLIHVNSTFSICRVTTFSDMGHTNIYYLDLQPSIPAKML